MILQATIEYDISIETAEYKYTGICNITLPSNPPNYYYKVNITKDANLTVIVTHMLGL